MDFLDSLDLDTTHKKSHRVRSWYLYEQFKSLERNQLDAAQKLKERSYQEHILRQELSERRARRKLYDQFGLCQSESQIKKRVKHEGTKSNLSVNADDSYETFHELREDENLSQGTEHDSSEETLSRDDSMLTKSYTEDFKSIEDHKDDNSIVESINSVVENLKCDEGVIDDIKELKFSNVNIAADINQQLEAVKKDIRCIEEYTELTDNDDISGVSSFISLEERELKPIAIKNKKLPNEYDNNIFMIWSRLVSFAYQIVQLNHGNCYYDYSSQFMTAVLACDVIRRGVNRMCHILQPYVSPIKFATDESDVSTENHKNMKRENILKLKKIRKPYPYKIHPNSKSNAFERRPLSRRKYRSEDVWQRNSRYFLENNKNHIRTKEESSNSIWPEFSEAKLSMNVCNCCRHKKVTNPMLKIARYIDSVLRETDDHKRV